MPLTSVVELGAKGQLVSDVQTRLRSHGFDPGRIDGDFGPLTQAAVRRFQEAKGLPADGVVTPETMAALEAVAELATVASTLVQLGLAAEEQFGLTVTESSAPGAPERWGPVHSGHAPTSFHFQGRAFDCSGPAENMQRFSAFVTENFTSVVAELIHNPNGSIKNGQGVDPSFWGEATFAAHVDHVHLAI